jgi:protein-tyrosine-phosphatase
MSPVLSAAAAAATIVFVCEHGNVKSLIASQWFNRLAAERGVTMRAVSRGVTPDSPAPPAVIAERLQREGFDVRAFQARRFSPEDLRGASRVVMLGTDAPAWVAPSGVAVERWDAIPPATERYDEAREALRTRILALIDALKKQPPR